MSGDWTPGPWAWCGNAYNGSVYLATMHSGRRFVMDFVRWGMRGAQPRFQPSRCGMVEAKELLQFQVGDQSIVGVTKAKQDESVYRLDVRGIDCADARLIAAAPELADCVIRFLEKYDEMESADLFKDLPGEEAQRVVAARKVMEKLLPDHYRRVPADPLRSA